MRHLTLAAALLAVGVAAAGCSSGDSASSGVDPNCDAAGVQETITHIVNEAALQFGQYEELACSGNWTFAQAVIEGEGGGSQSFVFQQQGDEWVLKAPELVCGTVGTDASVRPDDAELPADLWPTACADLFVTQ